MLSEEQEKDYQHFVNSKYFTPSHFLKVSNADGSFGVEVVVFNREEICMMSLEKCEI